MDEEMKALAHEMLDLIIDFSSVESESELAFSLDFLSQTITQAYEIWRENKW